MSSPEQWTAVEQYITRQLVHPDAALDQALADSAAAGLPPINVSPNLGKLLMLLARMQQAKNILEIGTLGGYSTIWLARGLSPGGRVITLEYEAKHADVARKNIARAAVADRVDLILGRALDSLPSLAGRAPFDLFFIDADKENNAAYFNWALKLSRPGSLVVIDNVVRKGAVVDPSNPDSAVIGTRKLYDTIAAEKRVIATALQTVGSKSYDGFAMALVVN